MKLIYTIPATIIALGTAGIITQCTWAKTTNKPVNASVALSKNTTILADNTQKISKHRDLKPGGLFTQTKDGKQQVFPLKHTEVKAKISGNVSRVEVTQTFENPFQNPLEAIYVFPLPDEAAVDEMEIKIGDRVIKGNIKKREEAKQIYEQAKREGRTAGLLEQERDNIFTQSLANIKPGEKIDVTIRYNDSLPFEKGNYEFVFPMVVGPRYIPGNPIPNSKGDTDQVPDASRITPPVIKPGTRSGHDINVTVEIDAGMPINKITSTSHKITIDKSGEKSIIKLAQGDNIPNKDLILRYQVSGEKTEATVLTDQNDKGGHFAVYLIPAVEYKAKEIVPKDVVFLMDTSGSQSGDPLVKSQELMRRFINGLNPNDTFTIMNFANTTEKLSATPLRNTPANRAKAIAYINQLSANGGSELLNGIKAVLNFPESREGRLRSVVLLTDGYIGNDNEVIAEVQQNLKTGNRLYSFGVGSGVNRYLLDRLGEVGRGTSQVIRQDEQSEEVAEKFFRQINNPVLTNIQVIWQGSGEKPEIYPLASPDLFANQPLVLFGKKKDKVNGTLKITGIAAGGRRYEKTISVNFNNPGNPAISQLWGRAKIKDLTTQMYGGETTTGIEQITNTALDYKLLSQYTAFVAVSEEVRVNPDGKKEQVQVPVEMPQGVSYEGIFGREEKQKVGGGVGRGQLRSTSGIVPLSPLLPSLKVPQKTSGGTRGSLDDETDNLITSTKPNPTPKPQNEPKTEANKPSENNIAQTKSITIISANGLAQNAIKSLELHLQSLFLPPDKTGEIVLKFTINKGRVKGIVLDDKASTLQDKQVIEMIKRSLLTWNVPNSHTGSVTLRLKIN